MSRVDLAAGTLERWYQHPAAMVREAFGVEPDVWQEEALEAFPNVNRLAMKACKGPGKTAVLAWLILNFLATRHHSRVGAASITGDNLDQNLWPELAKWLDRSPYLKSQFLWTKTKVEHRKYPATWWAHARTWPKTANAQQQADALAGLHADYAMWVADESGGMPQAVMTTMEAVLASGIETKVVQGGNPTSLSGPLYRACKTDRAHWYVVQITGDPDNARRSPRIDLKWAKQQIASFGRDNPWVMVNVLGEFPPESLNALLGVEDVEKAMRRHHRVDALEWAQKRLGIDVARYGDDRTVIFPRQGPAAFTPRVMRFARGASVSTEIAGAVATAKAKFGSEVELMDVTGGWAAGARDVMLTAGLPVIELEFGGKPRDARYKNMRAELWFRMAEWVKKGGGLPNLPELVPELTEPTYTFTPDGKFLVEPKDMVKARLGSSPDLADALACTFGLPEMPRSALARRRAASQTAHDFDPYAGPGTTPSEPDPFDPFHQQ